MSSLLDYWLLEKPLANSSEWAVRYSWLMCVFMNSLLSFYPEEQVSFGQGSKEDFFKWKASEWKASECTQTHTCWQFNSIVNIDNGAAIPTVAPLVSLALPPNQLQLLSRIISGIKVKQCLTPTLLTPHIKAAQLNIQMPQLPGILMRDD